MKIAVSFRVIIILCLTLTLISIQGCKQKKTPLFFIEKDVVEIPFEYNRDGYMFTKVVVEKDTMDFIIDTGSTLTFIPYSNDIKNIDPTIRVLDGKGTIKDVSKMMVENIRWGELAVKNLSCGINQENKNYGIIGGDILRNFCVQINNVKSKIVLSKNVPIMKGNRTISIPFELNKGNYIRVSGSLGTSTLKDNHKKEYSFLFDTGCIYEIMLNGKEPLPPVREQQYWKASYSFAFSTEKVISNSTFFLTNFKLKDCLFHNVIGMGADELKNFNLIGTTFIRRFESITIDYSNKVLYFKLPEDSKMLKFSTTNITNAPTSHFALLCRTLASFGITFSETKPLVVDGIKEDWKESININDTLVGINNTIFNKDAWALIKKQKNKLLVSSLEFNQDPQLRIPIIIGNKIRFLFLKNNKLVVINTKRKTHLLPKNFVYSFLEENRNRKYFGMHINRDSLSNYSLHYPWSTLIQQKKEIIGYRNGKKIVITNEFKIK